MSYDTAVDVLSLPEDVLRALQDWVNVNSPPETSRASAENTQERQSTSTNITDHSCLVPDDNAPRCLERCKDIRARGGTWDIEALSEVICVGYTEFRHPPWEGEFTLKKGRIFTVLQIFGDHWAFCVLDTLEGAFVNETLELCHKIRNDKYCIIGKDNPNVGFLPLCSVTLKENYADFLSQVNAAQKPTKAWEGWIVTAPKRIQSKNAQEEWKLFKEIPVPHEVCVANKAAPRMKNPANDAEPFEKTDDKKNQPCGFYYRSAELGSEDLVSHSAPKTLKKKATRQFQKIKESIGVQGKRVVVEEKLKKCSDETLELNQDNPAVHNESKQSNRANSTAAVLKSLGRKTRTKSGTEEARPQTAGYDAGGEDDSEEGKSVQKKPSIFSLGRSKRINKSSDRSEDRLRLVASNGKASKEADIVIGCALGQQECATAAIANLPAPRGDQLGPVRESEEEPSDNLQLRDAGNLLDHSNRVSEQSDPVRGLRHLEGDAWPIVNPRRMSTAEPRGLHSAKDQSMKTLKEVPSNLKDFFTLRRRRGPLETVEAPNPTPTSASPGHDANTRDELEISPVEGHPMINFPRLDRRDLSPREPSGSALNRLAGNREFLANLSRNLWPITCLGGDHGPSPDPDVLRRDLEDCAESCQSRARARRSKEASE
jgi:hypothetical protein